MYSPDDVLIVQNICTEIILLFFCDTWPSIPVVLSTMFHLPPSISIYVHKVYSYI